MRGNPPLVLHLATPQQTPPAGDPRWGTWLTDAELAYARGLLRAEEHLSARKLAKEAGAGVLGWRCEPPWQDMEVRRRPGAAPALHLGETLSRESLAPGTATPGISLTHARGYAAALAWLPPGGGAS
ncbi:hypothetical protein [Streptomyces alboniger]|uniref:4'-phosphopantetheinyl transferase superfamily protein n=1 Tax=Streptomyces alboniger TaxID=132473 RepID=A0A5J6HTN4_STRAD|nr:hypothetical protein [Streptomyces alboniger]QEV21773.1 hypothetical protein CP975_33425 [Streptomyces alboniger]